MSELPKNEKKPETRKALGRGLSALFAQDSQPAPAGQIKEKAQVTQSVQSIAVPASSTSSKPKGDELGQVKLPLDQIFPNAEQPRKHFNRAKLEELSLSIQEQGLVQPIVVKKLSEGRFQIIAGERRWRASKLAKLVEIPVVIRDEQFGEVANDIASLVENIQREDLSPMELATSYQRMISVHGFTQDVLAKKLSLSRVAVANTLRLLRLPEVVRELVATKVLSEGQARALLALPYEEAIIAMAQETVENSYTVREVEAKVRDALSAAERAQRHSGSNSGSTSSLNEKRANEFEAVENELRELFGTKVVLRGNAGKGTVELYYSGKDSLNRIIHQLRASKS